MNFSHRNFLIKVHFAMKGTLPLSIHLYCAGAWFCVEVFVGQNDAFSCSSGLAGRCSGAAAGGGAGLVLGHGVARSGGGGGAHMTSSAIVCL